GRLFSLQSFRPRDTGHDPSRTCGGAGQIGKKAIAKIFVNDPGLILDDLLKAEIHAPRRTSKSSLCMLRLSGVKPRMSATRSQQGIFSISRNVCCVTSVLYSSEIASG